MFICHTMKTNCNYRSVCLQRFRASWEGRGRGGRTRDGTQSPSKYIVQYHHFTLRPGTWLTIYITYIHELWKLASLVITSNKTKLPLKGPEEHGAGQCGDRRVWPPRHLSVSAKSQDMWRFSMRSIFLKFQLKIFAKPHLTVWDKPYANRKLPVVTDSEERCTERLVSKTNSFLVHLG